MFAIYLPFLSIDRLGVSDDADLPVATIAPNGQAMRVVHVNAAAEDAGIRSGQSLADAKATVPELVTFDDDPTADRKALEELAILGQRFSPVVHIEDGNTIVQEKPSANHTYINGEDITGKGKRELTEGTVIDLAEGKVKLTFKIN